jgi:hypothetical protein
MFAQMASTAAGVAVGSTVGHVMGAGITGMFSGGSSEPQQVQAPVQQQNQAQEQNYCEPDQKAFMKCLDTNSNDITKCQFYLDMYKQCQNTQRQF